MNIVITGINGFVGKHVTRELTNTGHSVIGISREPVAHEDIASSLENYYCADIASSWPNLTEPIDAIIHLAGLAAVGPSFDHPQDYISVNSAIVTNMCENYTGSPDAPRIVIVSSGAVYDSTQSMPIDENSAVTFGSPYAVSKILVENQAAYYRSRGLECVVMRPFNHIGPGQLPGFLLPDLAEKIRARDNETDAIQVGNLDTERDYTDVRDVAKAYQLVATNNVAPKHLVYNVCSGESVSGHNILSAIVESMKIPTPEIEINQAFIRPNEVMDIRGDSSRLAEEFGWKRDYTLSQTVTDFVAAL